ncbi:MAG: tripartite tricarboxylate transporter TctB family protein [Caulobacteraceae bacterium]
MSANSLAGIVSIVLGLAYSLQAYNLPRASVGGPMAPIYFPLGLGVLTTIFGIAILLREIASGKHKNSNENKEKGLSYTAKLITYTCIVSVIYGILFERVGFIISTFFFMEAILFAVNGKDQWKVNSAVAAIFSIGIYFLFAKAFGISLPITPFINI